MKKKCKINYSDKPLGKIKVVDDFLPSPQDLVLKQERVNNNIFNKEIDDKFHL